MNSTTFLLLYGYLKKLMIMTIYRYIDKLTVLQY